MGQKSIRDWLILERIVLKIGIDARSLLCNHPRGEGKTLLRLYQEIAKLRPTWEFVLFGDGHPNASKEIEKALPRSRVVYFRLPGFRWNTWENIGLPIHLSLYRVDLLHGFSSGGPIWSPVPFVMTVHDLIPMKFDDGQSHEAVTLFEKRIRAGLRNAKTVIAISSHTKKDLLELFTSFHLKCIEVIPWGADEISAIKAKHEETHPKTQPFSQILAFGGGGAKRKNVEGVIRMFALVLAQEPRARLSVIGVTNQLEHHFLSNVIESLGIASNVELLQFVSEMELDKLYSSASCLVYLSHYEGFGLPPLEAMVRGVPIVASNSTSIPEVVGDAGILVTPSNISEAACAVLRLINDQSLKATLSQKALLRSRLFSWNATANKMIEVLEKSKH